MSVHSIEVNTQVIVPFAILTASLLGSMHCVSMCGGLIVAAAPTKRATLLYHLGRLIGYCSLGALFGLIGKSAFNASFSKAIPWITTLLLAATLIFLGVRNIRNKPMHLKLPSFFTKLYSIAWKKALANKDRRGISFVIGMLSAFLPCGWLYSFVVSAAATQSAIYGALVLFLFWIGTVPALTIAPILIQRILQPIKKAAPKLSGVMLICAGLIAIGIRTSPLIGSIKMHEHQQEAQRQQDEPMSSCHHHSE